MKKNQFYIAIILAVVAGFVVGYVYNQPKQTKDTSTQSSMSAMHQEVEIDPDLPVPTITITAEPDSKDGYNINVQTTNFTFTPQDSGKENIPNTGHAHIYVNDEKVGRVYGEWFHLSAKHLREGDNTIEVSLNGNDHSDWLQNGQHISSVVTVKK